VTCVVLCIAIGGGTVAICVGHTQCVRGAIGVPAVQLVYLSSRAPRDYTGWAWATWFPSLELVARDRNSG